MSENQEKPVSKEKSPEETAAPESARKKQAVRIRKKVSKKTPPKKHPFSHAREVAMQGLYQVELIRQPYEEVVRFSWLNEPMSASVQEYTIKLIQGVLDHWDALDQAILSFSDKGITQISIIVRCILRIGIFELMRGEVNPRILIDDLLNLTRQYEGDSQVGLVNGILDSVTREMNSSDEPESETEAE